METGNIFGNSVSMMRDLTQQRYGSQILSMKQRSEQIDLQQIKSIKDPKLQLRRVAQEMESIMIKMMFKQMKKNINKSEFMHGGFAEDVFDDFLTDEYAKEASRAQGMGVADMIYNQYSKFV